MQTIYGQFGEADIIGEFEPGQFGDAEVSSPRHERGDRPLARAERPVLRSGVARSSGIRLAPAAAKPCC